MTDFAKRAPAFGATSERLARNRAVAGLLAFVFVLALLIFVVETLSQLGVPQPILTWMITTFALAAPAVAAISARTVSLTEFAVANRQVTTAESTMAGAAGLFGAVFAIGIAAAFFGSEPQMSALALGLCGGCLVGGVLVAPYLRRSASQSPGDFLAARFGSRTVSAFAGIVVIVALLPMLVAELSLAGMVGGWTLGIGKTGAIATAAILMLLPPVFGGMRGVTVAAVLQFLLVLAAMAFTSIWMSQSATGHALPIAGYIAAAASLDAIGATSEAVLAKVSNWDVAGLGLCVTLGIAVFPALLVRSSAARSAQSSRSSIAWMLLFVALLSVAIASMAAVARWTVEESPGRSRSIAELVSQPWIVSWVARGEALVTLCGEPASEAGSACAAGPLKPGDLSIDPDIALLAAPEIAGLPPLFAMLTAAGCLVAATAAGSLLLFGLGRALGHDLYFRALAPRTPLTRRLLTQRLALVAAAGLTGYVAAAPPSDYFRLMLISLSLAASGLFPVLLLGVWWRRANFFGALAGMLAGFAIAAYLAAAEVYDPRLLTWLEPAGLMELAKSLGAEKAPLIAVPVGLMITVLISLVTPAPRAPQRAFANALLAPRDMAATDDAE